MKAKIAMLLMVCLCVSLFTACSPSVDVNAERERLEKAQEIAQVTIDEYEKNTEIAKGYTEAICQMCISEQISDEVRSITTLSDDELIQAIHEDGFGSGYAESLERQSDGQAEEVLEFIEKYEALGVENLSDLDLATYNELKETYAELTEGNKELPWFDPYVINREEYFTQMADTTTVQFLNLVGNTKHTMTIVAVWRDGKLVQLERNIRGGTV